MSIKLAILGILSWKSSTGYELKKIFEDSSFMYWSGNNNQIYKAHLIALCWEHEANALMIHYATLSEDFFKLKTKVAGNMIQKFINYGIKAATIVPQETIQKGRFKEMAMETNKGSHFRLYDSKEDAEKWLLK